MMTEVILTAAAIRIPIPAAAVVVAASMDFVDVLAKSLGRRGGPDTKKQIK